MATGHAEAGGREHVGLRDVSWWRVARRTVREFQADNLSQWAAALTYFGVLSLFPALLVLVSVLGLIGPDATQPLLDNLEEVAPGDATRIATDAIQNLEANRGASGLALVIGIVIAVWSASGYFGAFMPAANVIWDAPEGRPLWKRLPLRIGVTVLLLILLGMTGLAVIVTGPIARAVGDLIGLGDQAVTVWDIVKWPVLLLVLSLMIALLYWAAPNVRRPGFRLITPGSVIAVLAWVAASAAFTVYVATFSSYNRTYGAFAGITVFLIWMWIGNMAILFGAEFNAEAERDRAEREGAPADREPYPPLRDEPG